MSLTAATIWQDPPTSRRGEAPLLTLMLPCRIRSWEVCCFPAGERRHRIEDRFADGFLLRAEDLRERLIAPALQQPKEDLAMAFRGRAIESAGVCETKKRGQPCRIPRNRAIQRLCVIDPDVLSLGHAWTKRTVPQLRRSGGLRFQLNGTTKRQREDRFKDGLHSRHFKVNIDADR